MFVLSGRTLVEFFAPTCRGLVGFVLLGVSEFLFVLACFWGFPCFVWLSRAVLAAGVGICAVLLGASRSHSDQETGSN